MMNDPIRVLHIFAPNFRTRFGGPIFNWKFYFSRWSDPRVFHYVCDTEKNQLLRSTEAFDFDFCSDQMLSSRWERFVWIFRLFRNLNKYKESYDILHLHLLWWGGLLVALWSNLKGIPALYESVLLDSDTPRGILKQKLGRLKVWCLKRFKGILAISDNLASEYLNCGFLDKQVYTLVNCIDSNLFYPVQSAQEKTLLRVKLGLPSNAIILLFVGSLIKRKGIDILIKAFIDAYALNPNLYLLMIGPKTKKENPSLNEQLIEDLCIEIKQHGIFNQVAFIGLLEKQERLADYYRASDIFVFPSRNEGLPNVVLEAMATGLPIIVTQLPGLKKVIAHKENGLFVPIGQAKPLRDSILMLGDNRSLAKRIGCYARKDIEQSHSFMVWQAHLVEFYRTLR